MKYVLTIEPRDTISPERFYYRIDSWVHFIEEIFVGYFIEPRILWTLYDFFKAFIEYRSLGI